MPQIIPIKDLKNTSEISEMCHKTDEPIYVTKRSVNLIKELRAYSWALNKDGNPTNKPIDEYNHAVDSIRYAVMSKINKFEFSIG